MAFVAGALALGGLMGLCGVLALDGFTWGILGETWGRPGIDKASIESAFEDVQKSEWNLYFYVGGLFWIAGMIALTVSLIRSGAIPGLAGGIFALGSLMVGIEAAVADNTYFIVAAAVLFLGGAAVGSAIWRTPEGEFANVPA